MSDNALVPVPPEKPKFGGRPKGAKNKTPKALQDAVVAAAAASGFLDTIMVKTKDENGEVINEEWKRVAGPGGLDGYLRWAAINQPAEFIRLLGRILPLQVKTESTNPTVTVYKTVEEAEEAFRERGLPVPQLFSD